MAGSVFHSIGCAACHVRTLDGLDEIYGDLLLHDLGPELADPVAAQFALVLIKREDLRPDELKRAQSSQSTPNNPYGGGQGLTTLAEDLSTSGECRRCQRRARSRNLSGSFLTWTANGERRPCGAWRIPRPTCTTAGPRRLNEAISLHGGEALDSKQQFFALDDDDRLAVIAFMKCLRAPR